MGKIQNEILALNSAKHAIREAINAKGGTLTKAAPLADYPGAIQGLPSAGGKEAEEWCRVVFIDYDGTVLKDVFVEPGKPVTPPVVPTGDVKHAHLNFYGWNHSAEKLNSVQTDMCVGATYTLDEENVQYLYFEDVPAGTSIALPLARVKNTGNTSYEIDWGDGTVTEGSIDTSKTTIYHDYESGFHGWVRLRSPQSSYPCSVSSTAIGYTVAPVFLLDSIMMAWGSNVVTANGGMWRVAGLVIDMRESIVVRRGKERNYFGQNCRGHVYTAWPSVLYNNINTISFWRPSFYEFSAPVEDDGATVQQKWAHDSRSGLCIDILECPPNMIAGGTTTALLGPFLNARSLVLNERGAYYIPNFIAITPFPVRLFLLKFYGSAIRGNSYLQARFFFTPGATIYSGTGASFDCTGMSRDFLLREFAKLADTETTVTLALQYVQNYIRDDLSEILSAKGYTVAYT